MVAVDNLDHKKSLALLEASCNAAATACHIFSLPGRRARAWITQKPCVILSKPASADDTSSARDRCVQVASGGHAG